MMMTAIGLASCKSQSLEQSAGSLGTGEQKAAADTSEFEMITYLVIGTKPTNGQFDNALKKVNEIMKKKINAELEWQWAPWDERDTKYHARLESGEPLDLITIGTDWLSSWTHAAQGAFMPLDDLLPNYAPQTFSSIPKEDWLKSTYNGKIVLIPENDFTQWVNHGFFYRGDWAKEAGIKAPITDFPTMGKYFQYVKDHKPGVVPWEVPGSNPAGYFGYMESNTDMLELPVDTGYLQMFWAKSYEEKYTVVSPVFTDAFVDMAKMMKAWGDRGYWREDVLDIQKDDGRDKLKAGLSGADQHHTDTFKGERVEMDKAQPGSELTMFPFSATRKNLLEMPISHGGTAVGSHSRHPQRALMAYDLIRNDEQIYRLINYGIEGVSYVLKDGKLALPPNYDENRDKFYSNFWGGRVNRFVLPSEKDWDKISAIYAQYDTYKKPNPYGQFVFDKSKVETEISAMNQIANELGPPIVFGKAGDPAAAVEMLRSKLKAAGYEKVLAEVQRQMDEYKMMVEKLVESQK
jgi:putative aldouronate transport system substrate-binding protein